ncbi:MAG: hypothetical protein AAGB34_05510 [Planctomycetota bacterium]
MLTRRKLAKKIHRLKVYGVVLLAVGLSPLLFIALYFVGIIPAILVALFIGFLTATPQGHRLAKRIGLEPRGISVLEDRLAARCAECRYDLSDRRPKEDIGEVIEVTCPECGAINRLI